MARDHRLTDAHGNHTAYTCENRRFVTNVSMGHPHGRSQAHGSVFGDPLITHGGYTLWLEHVQERATGERLYWLMWYDPQGMPTIPLSSVFDRQDLSNMLAQLADFVP